MDLAPQIKTFARELQSRYNHAQISSVGTTHEGRPIEMVTASLNDGARRAGIVIDCGVHARECAFVCARARRASLWCNTHTDSLDARARGRTCACVRLR